MTGLWVLLAVVALALLLGVALRARSGRLRAASTERVPEPVRALLDPAAAVTLVQVSTEFCADCRRARPMLERFAEQHPKVRHVELDVTERAELAGELGVLSTPTTLALDRAGTELFRFSGLPDTERLARRCASLTS